MSDSKDPAVTVPLGYWTVSRKLAAIVVGCVGLGFSGMIAGQTYWEAEDLYSHALHSNSNMTRLLATQIAAGVRWRRPEVIERGYAGLRNDSQAGLSGLIAFDAEGAVLTAYRSEDAEGVDLGKAHDFAAATLDRDVVFSQRTADHFIMVVPVSVDAPASLGVERVRVGALAVAWSLADLKQHIWDGLFRQLCLGGAALILLIVVCIDFLKRVFSHPLEALTTATERLAYGDTGAEVPGTQRRDELGGLARAVEVFKRNVRIIEKLTADQQEHAARLSQALEKEREYNALQSEFVAMASHEFRTPLAIIDGTAQRIERRMHLLSPEDLHERVQKIRNAVQRMLALIESTLSASRLDAGKIELETASCDLAEIVADVCKRQQELSPLHNIVLQQAELPKEIAADAKKLEQVFTNLLSNAVKYAPESPRIEVCVFAEAGQAVVSVRDHGLGIPADEMPRLFQRYFRARTSTGIAGTGIGLNLVKRFVELHGGAIEVESVEGAGSTFTVRLPIVLPCETPTVASPKSAELGAQTDPDPDGGVVTIAREA